ncbi:hypothetical protein ACMZ45_19435, partial [Acinetobacter baumannii]|uniref:hypothetical protein n=1 Tax=Acinetobacter baumannii TaxID=470 RepID=UPI0039F0046E
ARVGSPVPAGRVIAKQVVCDSYQDGASFLENGGERGPQSGIIAPGSYRINPVLFDVNVAEVVDIPDNKVGIVTTREGKPLGRGEIAGPEVPDHNMFQNPQAFIQNGGCKGLQ